MRLTIPASLALLLASGAAPAGAVELYASFGTGLSFASGQSGGFNTEGPHPNTGEGDDTLPPFTGALGVALAPEELGLAGLGLRLEIAGAGNYASRFETNSFEPPVPTFFYETEVDAWTAMANLWVDLPVTQTFGVYAGGGVGIADIHLETSDNVVGGVSNDTNFAWTAGAGVSWRVARWAVLDLGYRYVDLGNASMALTDESDGQPAGNLTFDDLHAHQVLASFRIQMPAGWIF